MDGMIFEPIPAGSFRMGGDGNNDEKPAHRVRISAFEMGVYEVTVGQFAVFVADSGYDGGNECFIHLLIWSMRSGHNWRSQGFTQSGSHPGSAWVMTMHRRLFVG